MAENPIVIVGGGPAGLFCSQLLLEADIPVLLIEQTDSPGKKFILAGLSGGLNITNSLPQEFFVQKYYEHVDFFSSLLRDFSNESLENWCRKIGTDTFKGNGGKIFTVLPSYKIMKIWLNYLKSFPNFVLKTGYSLIDINNKKQLTFIHDSQKTSYTPDYAIFALGGCSYQNTGSDGKWASFFNKTGIETAPFKPANCGFSVEWSPFFKNLLEKEQLKQNIEVSYNGMKSKGEIVLTPYGIEGSGIYSLSYYIRREVEKSGFCMLSMDLFPELPEKKLSEKMSLPIGKNSLSNYLRKTLKISHLKFILLKELAAENQIKSIRQNPGILKNLSLRILQPRPAEEAISTAGGISFKELDDNMMLKKIPDFYIAGEMADWEAPTGGFMLQGCFSTAYRVANHIIRSRRSKQAFKSSPYA